MQKEIWKNINGYENKYLISNLGRIKRLYNNKEIILKQVVNKKGYCIICLFNNYKVHRKRIHRLVAQAFINNNLNKNEVNHKDGNKLNNCVDNLEWNNHKENTIHAYKNGLMKRKLKDNQIIFIRKSKLTQTVLAKKFNVSQSCISSTIRREFNNHI